jgi:hypothetical protein
MPLNTVLHILRFITPLAQTLLQDCFQSNRIEWPLPRLSEISNLSFRPKHERDTVRRKGRCTRAISNLLTVQYYDGDILTILDHSACLACQVQHG